MPDEIIPATPTPDDYEREAHAQDALAQDALAQDAVAQEAFGVADDQGEVFADDPVALFAQWLKLAGRHEPNDPNAMSLATVDSGGMPDVRVVLLKDLDENEGRGAFSFYSNTQSAKGEELAANPRAALAFHWKTIRRQVRVRGTVRPVPDETSDAYFASRSRGAQIGAWASQQSREMAEEGVLETRIADYESVFEDREVPRPEFWRGYEVVPDEIEFWVNRPYRLHDRKLFTWTAEGWQTKRLYP